MKCFCFALFLVLFIIELQRCDGSATGGQGLKGRLQQDRRNIRPNIILILTDDQDVELGSLRYKAMVSPFHPMCGGTAGRTALLECPGAPPLVMLHPIWFAIA
ncbi:UNVERIFIED_CONTAM: hypothetical protein FKN15_072401 [Acipenser sinensis]